ncbi:FecR family protein [Euzebyella saccharophila]|uniref:FecR family protein n=1 Tax=Euzebyella saccharophila TaxID=679664 RepID=A0ABV8JQ59_9FLAO|nr:FecR domain-containing protein [Euzebyella saccharophila]
MKNHNPEDIDIKSISVAEKKKLKARILSSVENHKEKKIKLRNAISIAASIAILLASGLFFNQKKEASIKDFVKSSKSLENKNLDKVTLMLNMGENVNLDEDNPTITYSNSGKKVNIGNSRSLTQVSVDKDIVVYNTLVVPYGKRSIIQLSDGSTVWINSGSRFVYPAVFTKEKREVYIEGEAIFEVAHNENRPFIVNSENQKIEVLGTVFNVNNYADEGLAFTVLKSGSVQISYARNASETYTENFKIEPGSYAGYNKKTNSISSKKVDVERYFSWREGVLIFKNDNLKTIMRRLSRYYNIDITIDSEKLANETFSGYLDLKDDVEEVIETIKKTTDLKYNRTEIRKITITTN